MRFIILALPRSRTAWLANFLTYDNSFCFHEPLVECNKLSELVKKLDRINKLAVGISDTMAVLFADKLIKLLKPKIVIVKRPIQDCQLSLKRLGIDADLSPLQEQIDYVNENYDTLTLDYSLLSSQKTGEAIWNYCVGSEFNKERWEQLVNTKVEIMLPEFIKKIELNTGNIKSLLREI